MVIFFRFKKNNDFIITFISPNYGILYDADTILQVLQLENAILTIIQPHNKKIFSGKVFIQYNDILQIANQSERRFSQSYIQWIKEIHQTMLDKQNALFYKNQQIIDDEKEGYVYFVSDGTYVKIGFTGNIEQRLITLQTGSPNTLTIKKIIPNATIETEKQYHEKFKYKRVRGEWFNLSDEEIKDIV